MDPTEDTKTTTTESPLPDAMDTGPVHLLQQSICQVSTVEVTSRTMVDLAKRDTSLVVQSCLHNPTTATNCRKLQSHSPGPQLSIRHPMEKLLRLSRPPKLLGNLDRRLQLHSLGPVVTNLSRIPSNLSNRSP